MTTCIITSYGEDNANLRNPKFHAFFGSFVMWKLPHSEILDTALGGGGGGCGRLFFLLLFMGKQPPQGTERVGPGGGGGGGCELLLYMLYLCAYVTYHAYK